MSAEFHNGGQAPAYGNEKTAEGIRLEVELLHYALVQDIISLLGEALAYVPAGAALRSRIADVLVRADEQALQADRDIAQMRARMMR